jgi:hypothetical protein
LRDTHNNIRRGKRTGIRQIEAELHLRLRDPSGTLRAGGQFALLPLSRASANLPSRRSYDGDRFYEDVEAGITGFDAVLRAAGLRAAGLRAAVFRAAGLRAVVLRAVVLRFVAVLLAALRVAGFRAVVLRAVVLRAVVLRVVRLVVVAI